MMKVIDILPDLYYLELTFIFSSTFLKLSNPLALKTPMSADSFFFFFPPQLVPSPSTFWVSPHFPIKRTTWTYSFTLPNTHHSALLYWYPVAEPRELGGLLAVHSVHYLYSKCGVSSLGTPFTIKRRITCTKHVCSHDAFSSIHDNHLVCVLAQKGSSTVNLLYVNLARSWCLVKHQSRYRRGSRPWVKQFTLHDVSRPHPISWRYEYNRKDK